MNTLLGFPTMRAPSHAPAVRYPHGRPRLLARGLSIVAASGLACILGWLWAGTADSDQNLKAATGLGLWVLCAAVAGQWWRAMPVGHVAWDGAQWLLQVPASADEVALLDRPQVHLDFQACMLLSLRPAQGRATWLWLERRSDARQWQALRRAVYSPARIPAPGMAAPMGASTLRREDEESKHT